MNFCIGSPGFLAVCSYIKFQIPHKKIRNVSAQTH